jgi:hypothetical protein
MRDKQVGEAEGEQGEGTRGLKEAECGWKVREMRAKEAEQLGKAEDVRRTAGRGGPPVAPPRKLQLPPTKANFPGPFSGFQMTIPAVR